MVSFRLQRCASCGNCCVRVAGAITSSSDAAFELHVVPPSESDAELSHTIDSFAQATDADLAAGQDALQAQLREVVTASQKAVRMLVGASAARRDVSQVFVESSSAPLLVQGKL